MIKVGITGGIGSGKSTVCEVWADQGGYVLNADALAKQLMGGNKDVRKELIDTFGPAAFHADGSLNRTHLAEQAFRRDRVDELNAIVHPRLPALLRQKMEQASREGYKVGIYEAALLLELTKDRLDYFDHIVLVLADEGRRLRWVKERDDTATADVKSRMDKQRNFEQAASQAHIVIRNNGTLAQLKEKARSIFDTFLSSSH